jgi:hypothetical protein
MAGVVDARQAHEDYMLKCQGCHRPDGSGDDRTAPPMRDTVARFLGVPGGRAFLGRVPGVATTNLDDRRLTNLLNWTLYQFDPAHVPAGFAPYTPEEIGRLRADPIRSTAWKRAPDWWRRFHSGRPRSGMPLGG